MPVVLSSCLLLLSVQAGAQEVPATLDSVELDALDAQALQQALDPFASSAPIDDTDRLLLDASKRSQLDELISDEDFREAAAKWIRWATEGPHREPLRSTDNPAVVPREVDGELHIERLPREGLPDGCAQLPSLRPEDRSRLEDPRMGAVLRATGAVLDDDGDLVGSGWLASGGLVGAFVTAAHVVEESGLLIEYRDGPRVADDAEWTVSFDGDLRDGAAGRFAILGLAHLDPEADLAVLAVAPRSKDGDRELPASLPVGRSYPARPPERVAAVGFTGRPPREDLGAEYALRRECWFQPAYQQRTVSFGAIALWLEVDGAPVISHDAGAMSGASGGPIVDAATGRVIGIHRGDDRLTADEDRLDPARIRNEATESIALCAISAQLCATKEAP